MLIHEPSSQFSRNFIGRPRCPGCARFAHRSCLERRLLALDVGRGQSGIQVHGFIQFRTSPGHGSKTFGHTIFLLDYNHFPWFSGEDRVLIIQSDILIFRWPEIVGRLAIFRQIQVWDLRNIERLHHSCNWKQTE